MSSAVDTSDSEDGTSPPKAPTFDSKSKSKKKRKSVPPQETINGIWSRFSARKFSKATVILPFASQSTQNRDASKPSKAPQPERNNLLVSEDYERAVQECRARVKKLIRECRRVNMRYRDSEFDIDWDLKWEKGYCLNSLGENKFEIDGRAFSNPTTNSPKAVKRVHEIFDNPTFLKDKVSPSDVKQGSLGDCWLMASLTALANMDIGIKRICVEYDTQIGIYGFVFHRDGEWIHVIIDDKLYLKSPDWDSPSVQRHLLEQTDREDVEKDYRKTYQTGSQSLFFAHCRDANETWLPLLEKAYAKAHGDYGSLSGGWIGEGVEDLTGGVTTELLTSDILDTEEFWRNEIMKVNKEFLFGCSTGLLDGGYGSRDGISEGHAYVVMEARELSTGEKLVKLRNPWGKGKKGNWEGAWSDGSKEFTPEAQQELNHKFGNDSVFWISYKDLLRKYQHFDRTRLFMDCPDWRITQKWITVEVPWKAEFEQKFKIVLKKESPIVLVLSQLDDRYFEGLQGQYTFRLQFRLHEANSPEEDDYIVRSHGNYLMERSVVTELKSLKAGTYTVFVMVVADRNTSRPSVEDVVKKQCRKRIDNDKLAQVGMSYDIAHSKSAAYTASKAASRKKRDKAKAREARIALRRKNWERRQLSREIVRKQDKKNREKREEKEAKDAAEAKAKVEKEPKDKAIQTDEVKVVAFEKEDKSIQTEDRSASSAESDKTVIPPVLEASNETDKGVQTDYFSASESPDTPGTSNSSSVSGSTASRAPVIRMPAMYPFGPPPPPPPPPPPGYRPGGKVSLTTPPRGASQRQQYNNITDGESSASPISDFDDLYSDDDPTLKPRTVNTTGVVPKSKSKDSDDEDGPDPWNAICIVGLRVYSKDEQLEVRIFEEGDEEVEKEGNLQQEDEGSEADVEDCGDEMKKGKGGSKKGGDNVTEPKIDTSDASNLPITAKEDEALILLDDEKKALILGAAESTGNTENKIEAEPDKAVTLEDASRASAGTEKKDQAGSS